MQSITDVNTASQGTSVISVEELKAFLYLTIRGDNQLTHEKQSEEKATIDAEHGVDVKA